MGYTITALASHVADKDYPPNQCAAWDMYPGCIVRVWTTAEGEIYWTYSGIDMSSPDTVRWSLLLIGATVRQFAINIRETGSFYRY